MKIIVFDIGGTLMEYTNMPNVWTDYYPDAFKYVREKLQLPLSDKRLSESVEILRQYNPSVKYREKDYSPEKIFGDATSGWDFPYSLNDVINSFFENMRLTPLIYSDTIPALKALRRGGCKIATLTDVATGMPDNLHRSYFTELLPYFDLYVSSQSCGYRKPNIAGLTVIEKYFGEKMQNFIFVGDEPKDIKTAQNAGCRSVLIDRKNKGISAGKNYTVKSLEELIKIVEEFSY